ncbi:PP2C family protein-serine/threonine phosphatase [Marinactinospora thermotolerans]|uniref:PP2C family protein-serine/threonine phosphatase n=1 Tax=Marinactinospora thermotolerans TaxID=531310 RepID=UPI003D93F6FD
MAACRNARRTGNGLDKLTARIDQALSTWLPDQFCTGIFLQLDLTTGTLDWTNCGHPPPLLIRDQRVIDNALEGTPEPPLGLPSLFDTPLERSVQRLRLQPGDRILLYTDGVTEARDANGALFGLERFTDFIIRATAVGDPAPEALRRLIHAILDHQHCKLSDDATILLIEWMPHP